MTTSPIPPSELTPLERRTNAFEGVLKSLETSAAHDAELLGVFELLRTFLSKNQRDLPDYIKQFFLTWEADYTDFKSLADNARNSYSAARSYYITTLEEANAQMLERYNDGVKEIGDRSGKSPSSHALEKFMALKGNSPLKARTKNA